jgi:hypothetical protein
MADYPGSFRQQACAWPEPLKIGIKQLCGFQDADENWDAQAPTEAGTVVNDMTNFVVGNQGLTQTSGNDNASYCRNYVNPADHAEVRTVQSGIGVSFYIEQSELAKLLLLDVHLLEGVSDSKGYRFQFNGPGAAAGSSWPITAGWNTIWLSRDDAGVYGAPDILWNDANPTYPVNRVAIGIRRVTGGADVHVTWGEILWQEPPCGIVLLDYDGADSSQYTLGYPITKANNLVANTIVIPTLVGTALEMTWANLRTLRNGGWGMLSHTNDHSYFTSAGCAISNNGAGKIRIALATLSGDYVVGENVYIVFSATYATGTYAVVVKAANYFEIDLAYSTAVPTATVTHPAAVIRANLEAADQAMRDEGIIPSGLVWSGNQCVSPLGRDVAAEQYTLVRGTSKGLMQRYYNNRSVKLDAFTPGDLMSSAYFTMSQLLVGDTWAASAARAQVLRCANLKNMTRLYTHEIVVGNPPASNGQNTVYMGDMCAELRTMVEAGQIIVVNSNRVKAIRAKILDDNSRPRDNTRPTTIAII